MRENRIHDLSELSRLATLPCLTQLWCSSTAFATTAINDLDWRVTVFNYFAAEDRDVDRAEAGVRLKLNGQEPTYTERKSIHKRSATPDILHTAPETSKTSPSPTRQVIQAKKDRSQRKRHPRIIDLEQTSNEAVMRESVSMKKKKQPSLEPLSSEEEGGAFRRKMEALRDEVGDGWLKVLGESEFGELSGSGSGERVLPERTRVTN